MDIFENEPEVPEELLGLESVVLLPHVGSATVETRTAMIDLLVRNLEACLLSGPTTASAIGLIMWLLIRSLLEFVNICIQ